MARKRPGFGEVLRRYRAAAGLTQEELAERARLSPRGISDLERGVIRSPRDLTVRLLAEALGLAAEARALLEASAEPGRVQAPLPFGLIPPLVGRVQEMALLEGHLLAPKDHRSQTQPRSRLAPVLMLAGEPGIGKSRLLQELAQRARQRGLAVLVGGCYRQGGQLPYAPLLDALDQSIRDQSPVQLRADLQGCAWLVRLLPELADGPIPPLPSWTVPPEQERRLTFTAVARFLANVAGPAGTLIVLDDLQWAGDDALDLLAMLARSRTDPPLRIVGAYRDTEVGPSDSLAVWLADLAQASLVVRQALGPLAAEEAEQLLAGLVAGAELGSGAAGSPLRRQVLQRAGGVPFFLVSYAHGLRARAPLTDDVAVPWDLAQGVRQRVTALPERARRVLGVAAIMGRRVPLDLLVAVTGEPEEDALSTLEAACRVRLLVEDGSGAYQFAHDVIREVVEADLGTPRRAGLHRRVAEALEPQPEAPIEALAYHYSRSSALDKAALYLERAGDNAWAQHATASARDYYLQAADRLERLGRPLEVAHAREKLGRVLTTAACYDAAVAELERAVEGYGAAGQPERAAGAIALIGESHFLRGSYAEGIGRLQTLLAALEGSAPSPGRVASYTTLALLFLITGRFDEELVAAERAVDLASALADERLLVPAEQGRGQALLVQGRPAEASRLLEDLLHRAVAAGDLVSLYRALLNMAGICLQRGEFERERQYIEQAREATEQLGDPEALAFVLDSAGWAAWFRGEWAAARELHEQALTLIRGIGPCRLTATASIIEGVWRYWNGAWEGAARCLEEGIAQAERSGDLQTLPAAHWVLAELDLLAGRPAAAVARLEPLLDRPGLQESVVTGLPSTLLLRTTLAWAHLEMGATAAAQEATALTIARASALGYRLPVVDGLRVQGMAYVRLGRWDEARRAYQDGLALARAMPYPSGAARLLHMDGLLYAQRGERAAARERLEEALAVFRSLGARKDAERVERALAEPPLTTAEAGEQ